MKLFKQIAWGVTVGVCLAIVAHAGLRRGTHGTVYHYSPSSGIPYSNGNSLFFDESNDIVACGSDASLDFDNTDPFSIAFWVQHTNTGQHPIIGKYQAGLGYMIDKLITSNLIRFSFLASGANGIIVDSSIPLRVNKWDHVVITYDGSQTAAGVNIYINGMADPSISVVQDNLSATTSNAQDLKFGDKAGTGTLDAYLDEVSIWSDDLTESEARDVYNNGTHPDLLFSSNSVDLVSWWRMGDLGFSTIEDQISTNDCTPSGMTEGANLSTDYPDGADSPSKLAFGTEPVDVVVNATQTAFTVEVQDSAGNLISNDVRTITIAFDADPSSGTASLGGTLTVAAVGGIATFSTLTIDTEGVNYDYDATAALITTGSSAAFDVTAAPAPSGDALLQEDGSSYILLESGDFILVDAAAATDTLLASQEFGKRPTAVDMPTEFKAELNYTMAIGETHGFLLKVNTPDASVDLNCSGTAVSGGDVTCTFYKLWAFYPDNSSQYMRPSFASSPATGTDAYYDPAVPIPTGASNFVPEATSTDEYVWMDIAIASGASATSDAAVTINFGDTSIDPTLEIVAVTLGSTPVMQILTELSESDIDDGHYGGYDGTSGDQRKVDLLKNYSAVLKNHRITAYKNILSFLDIDTAPTPDDLDVDEYSGILGDASFRTNVMDILGSGFYNFWMSSPQLNSPTNVRVDAYSQAAAQTITSEASLSHNTMMTYVWDEPGSGDCSTVKGILDEYNGDSSGHLFLTANSAYDDTTCSGSITFSSYSDLILCPVINHVKVSGGTTDLSSYSNGSTCLYTSCQGNCQTVLNTDSFTGSDETHWDIAYIDLPSVHNRAALWGTQRTSYRDKVEFLLHFAAVEGHGDYDGVSITPVADVSDSLDGTYFILDGSRGSRCFWIDVDDSGTTEPGGCSGADNSTEITTIVTNDSAATVTAAVNTVIDASTEFESYSNTSTTINVVGDVYDGVQSAGTSGFTIAFNAELDMWKSPRRFGVMGDGTLMYAKTPGFKPFVGIDAFADGNDDAIASLRMKVLRDASFETDVIDMYDTRLTTNIADNVVTDTDDFETNWGEWEYLRWRIYKAEAAGNAIADHTLSGTKLAYGTQPATAAAGATLSAFTVNIENRLGAVETSDSSSVVTLSIESGTGTLGGTTAVTASSGVVTFSDITISTAGTFTMLVSSGSLTSATSSSFVITAATTDLNTIGTLVYWWNSENVTGTITSWDQLDNTETETLASSGSINIPSVSTASLNSINTGFFDQSNSEASESALSPTFTDAYILIVFKLQGSTAARTCIASSWDRFNDWGISATGSAGSSKLASVQVGSNQNTWVDGSAAIDTNWHHLILKVSNAGNEEVWLDGAATKDIDSNIGAASVEAIRIGNCGPDMDVTTYDGGGGPPEITGEDVEIAEVAMWSALDMTGAGTGDEYEEVNTYVCDRYGSTMTGCP